MSALQGLLFILIHCTLIKIYSQNLELTNLWKTSIQVIMSISDFDKKRKKKRIWNVPNMVIDFFSNIAIHYFISYSLLDFIQNFILHSPTTPWLNSSI